MNDQVVISPASVATEDDSPREAETRARILDAAIQCFSQFGNEKTTINDVARVAGLSRQTIYRYYADRAALLEAVNDFERERLRAEAAEMVAAAPSFEAFITALAARQTRLQNRYRTRQHLLERDLGLFQSLFLAQSSLIEGLRLILLPALTAAEARGELRPGLDLDQAAEWVAITLSGVARLTSATTFDVNDPEAVGRFVARHVCHGLIAAPRA